MKQYFKYILIASIIGIVIGTITGLSVSLIRPKTKIEQINTNEIMMAKEAEIMSKNNKKIFHLKEQQSIINLINKSIKESVKYGLCTTNSYESDTIIYYTEIKKYYTDKGYRIKQLNNMWGRGVLLSWCEGL